MFEADPLEDDKSVIRLVDTMPDRGHTPDGVNFLEKRIVEAARVSVAGEGVKLTNSPEKLISYMLIKGHSTPFEHVKFTFHVRCPWFVARQWQKHRTAHYSVFNEESARYGEVREDFYVPLPSRFKKQSTTNKQSSGEKFSLGEQLGFTDNVIDSYEEDRASYESLLEQGVARELARCVLPVSTYTQFYWSVDLWNLLHFCEKRSHYDAQQEIKVYAETVLKWIRTLTPTVHYWWTRVCDYKYDMESKLMDERKQVYG